MSSHSQSRVILVTGGNSGIGYELVRLLASQGHILYLSSRSEESGKNALNKLKSEYGLDARYVQLDVTSEDSVKRARDTVEKTEGRLDALVNNAGIATGPVKPSELTVDKIQEILNTNYLGIVRVTTTFLPLIRKAKNGVIVNISSQVGSHTSQSQQPDRFPPVSVAYYSSKAILNAYTISLAKELKEEGIRVNSVTPGLTLTNFPGAKGVATCLVKQTITRNPVLYQDLIEMAGNTANLNTTPQKCADNTAIRRTRYHRDYGGEVSEPKMRIYFHLRCNAES
ncbi:NAD(P)-binding protein [Marasmius fiardii PR-910]|nr:NAD(P)-binding protein [Marasmius fiardii PR-910]